MDFHLGKLSPRCIPFFQQPLQYPNPTRWYAAQPIGKNKLASMMSRISEEASISIRYTNNCLRATVATGLKRAAVHDRAIMSVLMNDRLIASGSDGASVMVGRKGEVAALLKQESGLDYSSIQEQVEIKLDFLDNRLPIPGRYFKESEAMISTLEENGFSITRSRISVVDEFKRKVHKKFMIAIYQKTGKNRFPDAGYQPSLVLIPLGRKRRKIKKVQEKKRTPEEEGRKRKRNEKRGGENNNPCKTSPDPVMPSTDVPVITVPDINTAIPYIDVPVVEPPSLELPLISTCICLPLSTHPCQTYSSTKEIISRSDLR
ncbi:unnamed protein product [Mytilus edulis]|uniref:Uncharacterized protein n=1 Tax=Mytilus edulis TaxID=6550 RepID=A0A8S3PZX6_MYTED|nr:unnamed protein product [Mytilus edulis]